MVVNCRFSRSETIAGVEALLDRKLTSTNLLAFENSTNEPYRMLSSHMGVRAIDIGQVQLSMHSIRATTGALDPGFGVKLWKGFFDFYEEVDASFR